MGQPSSFKVARNTYDAADFVDRARSVAVIATKPAK